jgi:hypothetical protein
MRRTQDTEWFSLIKPLNPRRLPPVLFGRLPNPFILVVTGVHPRNRLDRPEITKTSLNENRQLRRPVSPRLGPAIEGAQGPELIRAGSPIVVAMGPGYAHGRGRSMGLAGTPQTTGTTGFRPAASGI